MTTRKQQLQHGRLLADLPGVAKGEERFEDILRCANVHIERIVSSASVPDTLYVQEQDEWVCLLQGEAHLWVDGETIVLHAGEHLFLPARTPHRVLATDSDPGCVWLAVHIHPRLQGGGEERTAPGASDAACASK